VKVGDLVVRKSDRARLLGIIVRIYSIVNDFLHKKPLSMAEVGTEDGIMHWKCRKIEVISESR